MWCWGSLMASKVLASSHLPFFPSVTFYFYPFYPVFRQELTFRHCIRDPWADGAGAQEVAAYFLPQQKYIPVSQAFPECGVFVRVCVCVKVRCLRVLSLGTDLRECWGSLGAAGIGSSREQGCPPEVVSCPSVKVSTRGRASTSLWLRNLLFFEKGS